MRNRKWTFFVMILAILALTYGAFFGYGSFLKGANQMRYGIDIRGGVEAIYEPKDFDRTPTGDEMDVARTIIEHRLDNKNITDREVTVDKKNGRIIVRFPWKSDEKDFNPEKAIAELGQTARLTFRDSAGNVLIEGKHVKESQVVVNTNTDAYLVSLKFDAEGSKLFAEATGNLIGQPMAIYMDEQLLQAPTVNEKIVGGEATISGNFDLETAKNLADTIESGALPFSMVTKSHNTISPLLGSNSLHVMIIAGGVAFLLICLFMLGRYRLAGFISCFGLLLQLAGQLLALSVPQFSLTLPGIAGVILSLGMGVDANIIISERISDEVRNGKSLPMAIKAGYEKAFAAVFDGNITTAIVAVILMLFGSGTMLSFGYTLLVGIGLNFVAGIFATQVMLKSLIGFKAMRNPKLYFKGKDAKTINFYKKRWIAYAFSIGIMVIGLASCFIKGVQLDAQFKGGAMLTYNFEGEMDPSKISNAAEEVLDRLVSAQITTDLVTESKKVVLTLAGNTGLSADDQVVLNDKLLESFPESKLTLSESYMVEPYIGKQALIDSLFALLLAGVLMVVYVWYRFKRIGGLSAGVMAIVALLHDIMLVFFTFVVLGIPLNDSFIAVALTIIGYSMNDTVVIYDRIRENMNGGSKLPLSEIVDDSISQSLTRSICTSVTTAISVLMMYAFALAYGIESIQVFALPMMFGVLSGCYSTICIAGPLWVSWRNYKKEHPTQKGPKLKKILKLGIK